MPHAYDGPSITQYPSIISNTFNGRTPAYSALGALLCFLANRMFLRNLGSTCIDKHTRSSKPSQEFTVKNSVATYSTQSRVLVPLGALDAIAVRLGVLVVRGVVLRLGHGDVSEETKAE